MPHKQQEQLEAKQEALEAWASLPKSKPSKEALPPAGGGLDMLFGAFLGIFETIREHKTLSLIVVTAVITVIVALRLWI